MLQTARSKNSSSCKNGEKEKIKQKHKNTTFFPRAHDTCCLWKCGTHPPPLLARWTPWCNNSSVCAANNTPPERLVCRNFLLLQKIPTKKAAITGRDQWEWKFSKYLKQKNINKSWRKIKNKSEWSIFEFELIEQQIKFSIGKDTHETNLKQKDTGKDSVNWGRKS